MNLSYDSLRDMLTVEKPFIQDELCWLPVVNKKMKGELNLSLSIRPGAIRLVMALHRFIVISDFDIRTQRSSASNMVRPDTLKKANSKRRVCTS